MYIYVCLCCDVSSIVGPPFWKITPPVVSVADSTDFPIWVNLATLSRYCCCTTNVGNTYYSVCVSKYIVDDSGNLIRNNSSYRLGLTGRVKAACTDSFGGYRWSRAATAVLYLHYNTTAVFQSVDVSKRQIITIPTELHQLTGCGLFVHWFVFHTMHSATPHGGAMPCDAMIPARWAGCTRFRPISCRPRRWRSTRSAAGD